MPASVDFEAVAESVGRMTDRSYPLIVGVARGAEGSSMW